MSTAAREFAIWSVVAVIGGALLFAVLKVAIKMLSGRSYELESSRRALVEYEELIDRVLNDPATPESARDLLLEFDRGVMDRRTAAFVANSIFYDHSTWVNANIEEPNVLLEMRAIGKTRPDLYDAFTKAIAYGFMATMLGWYFPARALSFLLVNFRHDPMTPARAVVNAFEHEHHDDEALQAA